MANYVDVDSETFDRFMSERGFRSTVQANEVVYVKQHDKNPDVWVKVYSSFSTSATIARACGADCIRVVAILQKQDKSYPLYKGKRVLRTSSQESVQARTMDRIVDAFARCDEWLSEQATKNASRHAEVAPRTPRSPEEVRELMKGQGELMASSTVPTTGEHVGQLGDRIRATVKVVSRKSYNDKFCFTMQDAQYRTYVYWSKRDLLQVNETYDLGAKIIGYNVFQNVRQNIIDEVAGKRVVL